MRHRKKRFQLGKPADQRKALIRSLLIALVTHERIRTTYRRAKEASRWADKLITLGKKGDIHARRQAYRWLQDRDLVKKLFDDIAPRFKDVNGGYTRVIKINNRRGDNALLAILEFTRISEEVIEEKKRLKKLRKERREKKAIKEEEIAPAVEEVKVEEEEVKEKKPKRRKKAQEEPKVEERKEEKEEKPKEELKGEKKGFLEGLKGFLKRKRR